MADAFSNVDTLTAQGRKALAITPNDATDLVNIPKALYVGTAGDLTVTAVDDTTGTSVLFKSVSVGPFDMVRVKRVWATGTAAGSIVAVY